MLRGLHWDNKTWKLVQAAVGDIYLIVLDVRPKSPTYGKWESFIITERLIALMVITVFLAGCASIGKGAAEAVLEKSENEDTRLCQRGL